jgi:site-specific DNA recombinase
MGTAAFGKTRQGPPRPRLRAQCGRPLQPRWANQRHARPSRRGATDLLQGLVSCPGCGSADDGTGISHKAAQGRARDEADDRCLGTEA